MVLPGSLIPGVPGVGYQRDNFTIEDALLDFSCTRGFVVLVKASELGVDIEMVEKFLRVACIFRVDSLGGGENLGGAGGRSPRLPIGVATR